MCLESDYIVGKWYTTIWLGSRESSIEYFQFFRNEHLQCQSFNRPRIISQWLLSNKTVCMQRIMIIVHNRTYHNNNTKLFKGILIIEKKWLFDQFHFRRTVENRSERQNLCLTKLHLNNENHIFTILKLRTLYGLLWINWFAGLEINQNNQFKWRIKMARKWKA